MIKTKSFKKKLFDIFVKQVELKFFQLKKKKDRLLTPLVNKFPKFVTANHLSLFRLGLMMLFFFLSLAYRINIFIIIFVLLFGLFVDLLDGILARIRKQVSNRGALLDKLGDRFLWFFIYMLMFSAAFYEMLLPLIYLEIIFMFILFLALIFDFDSKLYERLNFVRFYLSWLWVTVILITIII